MNTTTVTPFTIYLQPINMRIFASTNFILSLTFYYQKSKSTIGRVLEVLIWAKSGRSRSKVDGGSHILYIAIKNVLYIISLTKLKKPSFEYSDIIFKYYNY